MNGPQHYRRAEDFLKAAHTAETAGSYAPEEEDRLVGLYLTKAQVHATLAQAAATAAAGPESQAWEWVFKS